MKRFKPRTVALVPVALLVVAFLAAVGLGAVSISPAQILSIGARQLGPNTGVPVSDTQTAVFSVIRLPRVVLALLIGTSLALVGAALQGLYRNPLADPALIGISSGGSLAAVAFIVAGPKIFGGLTSLTGTYALSLVTFGGALLSTLAVYRLSASGGKILVSLMLLAGYGVNAVAGAGTGIFTYAATDAQLRSITFWTLGSLGGANWTSVLGLLPFAATALAVLPALAKPLNAFALNEHNAAHLGVATERVKRAVMIVAALSVGASVAVAGIIGFVGLLVPNSIRMLTGPDHRSLLPLSALAGALMLVLADLAARTAFGAAELPIGILTALTGGPFFLFLLRKERRQNAVS